MPRPATAAMVVVVTLVVLALAVWQYAGPGEPGPGHRPEIAPPPNDIPPPPVVENAPTQSRRPAKRSPPAVFSGGDRISPFWVPTLNAYVSFTWTDPDGKYRLTRLRPAPYRVFACRGYDGGVVARAVVRPGETSGSDVTLDTPGAFVTGWIVNAGTQDPVAEFWFRSDSLSGVTFSRDDGTFTLGPLPAGEFRCRVTKEGYEPITVGPFQLEAGRTFEAPTIYAKPSGE